MKLTTPMTITAADSESRTITGRIVAFEEPANASTGKVVFAKGSIEIGRASCRERVFGYV